jgi:uncharacterized protein (TIGR03435 family)
MVKEITLALFMSCGAYGQTPAPPAFEVASVKPNPSGDHHSSSHTNNGSVVMRNVSLKQVVEMAYDVKDYALSAPDWLDTERFDISAKPPSGTPQNQFEPMLQTLLADRFKLAVHRESKVMSAYALVAGKNGPKLHAVEAGGGSHRNSDGGKLTAQKVSMPQLADFLARHLDRPVIDKTELAGVFDFELRWAQDDSHSTDSASGPSIFTAVQEQLGLKLQSQKLPVEILVVDHAERVPTEN